MAKKRLSSTIEELGKAAAAFQQVAKSWQMAAKVVASAAKKERLTEEEIGKFVIASEAVQNYEKESDLNDQVFADYIQSLANTNFKTSGDFVGDFVNDTFTAKNREDLAKKVAGLAIELEAAKLGTGLKSDKDKEKRPIKKKKPGAKRSLDL